MSTHEIKNGQGEVLPNGWQVWVWENPSGGFSYEMRHRGGDQAGGNQKTEAMARKVAGIIADTTIPDPQPVDPAWMVEVVREAIARSYDAVGMAPAAHAYRAGELDDSNESKVAAAALRLALSRGHVVLAPVMPSEEEMLAAAIEDAAQANERLGVPGWARNARIEPEKYADSHDTQSALQARRNVYASLGAVAGKAVSSGPVVPEAALKKAWDAGWRVCHEAHKSLARSAAVMTPDGSPGFRHHDVSTILENLKRGEA